jgi:hypothetical protein
MCPARVGAPQRARPGTGSAIFLASVAKAYPCHIAGRDVPDEKRGHHHPNPVVPVTVVRVVPVAVRAADVPRIIVEGAPAQHPVVR